jgi:hypothetical protein
VYSDYYLIYYSLDQSPLRIDHVDYCKEPNPLLRIGQNVIVIGIISWPQNILKVVITTQIEKSALPVKRHFHTCQTCINKEASASLRHTLTCSFERQVSELQLEKRERERVCNTPTIIIKKKLGLISHK